MIAQAGLTVQEFVDLLREWEKTDGGKSGNFDS